MKRSVKTSVIITILISMSVLVYLFQIFVFSRPEDTVFYFLEDLGFVPISVLLVTLGVNTLLTQRDRQATLEKVSIVVNEFYAEAGTELIMGLRGYITNLDEISGAMQMSGKWTNKDFNAAKAFLASSPVRIDIEGRDIYELQRLFQEKKDQILRLFENANLMEHDSFTDMLWAAYHVYDELRSRDSLENLPAADTRHLNMDVERAAGLLMIEWLESMRILKVKYPYLYSLAVRKCPFAHGKVVIEI